MNMSKRVLVLSVTAMASIAYGREPKADLEPIAIERGDHSGIVSRACAIGFRNLESYYNAKGALFVPELVTSHKGLYCHMFYEPTRAGFRASAAQDPVTAVLFDGESAETRAWARAVSQASESSAQLLPIPPEAVKDQVWPSTMVSGHVDGKATVLHAKSTDAEHSLDVLPVRVVVSHLSWDARDLLIVRSKADSQRTVLLYGDRSRHAWAKLRDSERAYLFRVEFGVSSAIHLSTGMRNLSEVAGSGTAGGVILSPQFTLHEVARIQHELTKASVPSSTAIGPINAIGPDRALLLHSAPR